MDSVYYVSKIGFVVGLDVDLWRRLGTPTYDRYATVKEIGQAAKAGKLYNTSKLKLINEI